MATSASPLLSQGVAQSSGSDILIRGTVLDTADEPVRDARVHLEGRSTQFSEEKLTDAKGVFRLTIQKAGTYSVAAEKLDKHSETVTLAVENTQVATQIKLVLSQSELPEPAASIHNTTSSEAMQFVDQPNFTVAGVMDFTAAGGHGSDSSLRTSEALARDTSKLKSDDSAAILKTSHASDKSEDALKSALAKSPSSFEANHHLGEFYLHEAKYSEALAFLQSAYKIDSDNRENEYDLALACKGLGDPVHSRKYVQDLLSHQQSGDLYRLAGEVDEALGDSLHAVREYQKAVTLDPSEQNFFSWGSELLIHRAIWQAQQVFEQGTKRYPASSRMLTGLGTALFAGAAYSESATRLCQASDLNPADQEPYLFLGKVQMAAPDRLPCIEPELLRFVQQQPGSAIANYLYAMAIRKSSGNASVPDSSDQTEAYLRKAIAIDPGYADAYLQLGVLQAARKDYEKAIVFYKQAIAADPGMSDAYYRLAVAYDRNGQSAHAKEEFQLHDEVARRQAAEIERQRKEVKQFLVVLPHDALQPPTQ